MPKSPAPEWSKARAHAMGEAMDRILLDAEGRALGERQPFPDALDVAFAAGCECIAAQLNVLVHHYGQVRLKADPEAYGGSSHYDFMAELMDDIIQGALARHLTRGERYLA